MAFLLENLGQFFILDGVRLKAAIFIETFSASWPLKEFA